MPCISTEGDGPDVRGASSNYIAVGFRNDTLFAVRQRSLLLCGGV
ncbi:MAG TPA: hypothetical protein VFF20_10355 [Pseudogracilibacillus sp.]|nr:hypothetical protein [Pseudogracilibacillus sp.]